MEEASVPTRMGRFMRGSGLKINHMEGVGLLRLLETSIWGIWSRDSPKARVDSTTLTVSPIKKVNGTTTNSKDKEWSTGATEAHTREITKQEQKAAKAKWPLATNPPMKEPGKITKCMGGENSLGTAAIYMKVTGQMV